MCSTLANLLVAAGDYKTAEEQYSHVIWLMLEKDTRKIHRQSKNLVRECWKSAEWHKMDLNNNFSRGRRFKNVVRGLEENIYYDCNIIYGF